MRKRVVSPSGPLTGSYADVFVDNRITPVMLQDRTREILQEVDMSREQLTLQPGQPAADGVQGLPETVPPHAI